jgi:hypothetical protein
MNTTSTTSSPTPAPKAHRPTSAVMSPANLEALADALTPLVLARIAAAFGAVAEPYSTRRGREPAEFKGRSRKWRAAAATIPGSAKIGRWVVVPRDAYAKWIAAQATPAMQTSLPTNAADEEWTPRRALEAAGLRLTR